MCNTDTSFHSMTQTPSATRSCSSYAAIYKSREVKKSKVYAFLNASDGTCEVFNAIEKTIHARQNKVVRQALAPENLRRFESMWLKHVQLFVDLLAAGSCNAGDPAWTAPKDVSYYGKNSSPTRTKPLDIGSSLFVLS